jgi:WD40 repeat protein
LPAPPQAHPGWVYSLRFAPTGTHLVSVGNAPRNQGYLAVWNVADGRLLYGDALPLGALYSVAISPNGKLLALGCGPRGRQFQEVDAYIIKMPNLDPSQAPVSGSSLNGVPSHHDN